MANPPPSHHKKHCRKLLQTLLTASGSEKRHEWSSRICHWLAHWIPSLHGVSTIATYAALETEVHLGPLHSALQDRYQFAYPLVVDDTLRFYRVADPSELTTGAFGILEPDPQLHTVACADELDLCLCPGLGFTRGGVRLGRGKAYYDSVLPQIPSTVFRVGIAFELQVRNFLPRDAHDVLMTHLSTEEGVTPIRAASS